MIYVDNPQKIHEQEDRLGLKSYSFAPQISAVLQSGNLYVYCVNNPITYSDIDGNIAIITFILIGSAVIGVSAALYDCYQPNKSIKSANKYGHAVKYDIAQAITVGISWFLLSYICGISAYNLYVNTCLYYGKLPISDINYNAANANTRQVPQIIIINKKLQHEYKHASDFGITGNWIKAQGEAYKTAIISHISSVQKLIVGTYGDTLTVYHYYNPITKIDVMVDMNYNYCSWMEIK